MTATDDTTTDTNAQRLYAAGDSWMVLIVRESPRCWAVVPIVEGKADEAIYAASEEDARCRAAAVADNLGTWAPLED